MAQFKQAPGVEAAASGEMFQLHANQVAIEHPPSGLFTLEQWFIIAMTGMAISALMLLAGFVLAWRRRRRRAAGRR
ncbi:hypothetical protein M1105_10080 [Limibaculum sp. FT325]|uniref:hypothetical protein n=1 Tax=Thermohalobaculum sediminis TaxID=2939436 RepID=UPI0020BF157F|nr:hypothetical protein [Limibaculum sediminis]MCL5777334.1 hypothetical protein [Limibaculum sediminis]